MLAVPKTQEWNPNDGRPRVPFLDAFALAMSGLEPQDLKTSVDSDDDECSHDHDHHHRNHGCETEPPLRFGLFSQNEL